MNFEPHFNFATLSDRVGDLQSSYNSVKRSAEAFTGHAESKELLKILRNHFAML